MRSWFQNFLRKYIKSTLFYFWLGEVLKMLDSLSCLNIIRNVVENIILNIKFEAFLTIDSYRNNFVRNMIFSKLLFITFIVFKFLKKLIISLKKKYHTFF